MKRTDFKVVGKAGPRHEAVEKVTGRASYLDDLALPDMVFGAILRSPHPDARVLRIDCEKAMKIPGVLAFLLPGDCPRTRFNCAGDVPSPLSIRDEAILTEEPRYAGDRIAAVAGLTPEICRAALDAAAVDYEILPALGGIREALKERAPAVHPEICRSNLFKKIEASQGDAEEALLRADHLFEEEFHTPAVHHACLEPVGCICDYRRDGSLTIWSTSQTAFQERRILSEIFDLPENRIRIIKPHMGGGFGSRQQLHNQPAAALLSKRVGRPVKIVNTRAEEMASTCVRHESICRLRVGVSRDGLLQAFHATVFHNAGAYASHSPVILAAQSKKLPYRVGHYKYEGHCVYTNTIPAGAWRGYGNPQITFAREVLFDRIARTLGMDPVAFRLKNHLSVGDRIAASPIVLQSCAIEACVREGERLKAEIDRKGTSGKENEETTESWGVAFAMHTSGPSNNSGMSSAVILANDDGSVRLLSGSADIGQGSETTLSQIAAEALGISLEDVAISGVDTLHSPYDTGTFASSQTYVAGQAVLAAAQDLNARLIRALARVHGVEAATVTAEQGVFEVGAGEKRVRMTFREAVRKVSFGLHGTALIGSGAFKAEHCPPPFAVCFAKVALHRSGSFELRHLIEVVDVGTPINPDIVTGQIHGGMGMGAGTALMEDAGWERKVSRTLSGDLLHYRLPTSMDLPRLSAAIVESFEPTGPMGAKSVGELSVIPVAPAIANALVRATGRELKELPVTRVFPHHRKRREEGQG